MREERGSTGECGCIKSFLLLIGLQEGVPAFRLEGCWAQRTAQLETSEPGGWRLKGKSHRLCTHQPAQRQVLIRPHPTRMEVVLITRPFCRAWKGDEQVGRGHPRVSKAAWAGNRNAEPQVLVAILSCHPGWGEGRSLHPLSFPLVTWLRH